MIEPTAGDGLSETERKRTKLVCAFARTLPEESTRSGGIYDQARRSSKRRRGPVVCVVKTQTWLLDAGATGGSEGGEGQDKGKGTFFFRSHDIDEGQDWRAFRAFFKCWMICERGWDEREKNEGGNDCDEEWASGWSAASGQLTRGFQDNNPHTNKQCTKEQRQINK